MSLTSHPVTQVFLKLWWYLLFPLTPGDSWPRGPHSLLAFILHHSAVSRSLWSMGWWMVVMKQSLSVTAIHLGWMTAYKECGDIFKNIFLQEAFKKWSNCNQVKFPWRCTNRIPRWVVPVGTHHTHTCTHTQSSQPPDPLQSSSTNSKNLTTNKLRFRDLQISQKTKTYRGLSTQTSQLPDFYHLSYGGDLKADFVDIMNKTGLNKMPFINPSV